MLLHAVPAVLCSSDLVEIWVCLWQVKQHVNRSDFMEGTRRQEKWTETIRLDVYRHGYKECQETRLKGWHLSDREIAANRCPWTVAVAETKIKNLRELPITRKLEQHNGIWDSIIGTSGIVKNSFRHMKILDLLSKSKLDFYVRIMICDASLRIL